MAKICPYCDSENSDSAKFCTSCGASLAEAAVTETAVAETDAFADPADEAVNQASDIRDDAPVVESPYAPPYYGEPVVPIPIGGLIAWSVIVILFCLIPGIVALVKVLGINSAPTVEEQQRRLASAKVWLIVGTVLGALSLIGGVGSRMMQY